VGNATHCAYFFNKDGKADFASGFKPDIEELDNGDKLPLGDPNEIMLKTAINDMTGGSLSATNLRSGFGGMQTISASIERKAWANKTIRDGSLMKKFNCKKIEQ
jgi:hypothetical protein